jgi:hypothetical protein
MPETDRWWVARTDPETNEDTWTEVEPGTLPYHGEIIYILHADEEPDEVLGAL